MSEKKNDKRQISGPIVRCPHCGREYHLCELALPGELLGKPAFNGIVKDPLGKIIYVDWAEEPETRLEYECDGCGRGFSVAVSISAKATPKAAEEDFGDLTSSLV